ncbi:MAG: formimidoylglutamate deiminase [Gemmatimonadota bacterium]
MSASEIIEADLTWTGRGFESEIQVELGGDGRIGRVGALGRTPTRRLSRPALLPGFVNAHSHAFQRGLRGQGERFPTGAGSFWTWREAMYGLVDRLDVESFTQLAVQSFREMRATGITTVGEFHYLHHTRDSADFALDRALLGAATSVGIRLVLLVAYYRTGGIGKPLEGAQRRFETASMERYWNHLDGLRRELGANQTLGAVVHSIRAASLDELAAVHEGAVARDLPLHMHVEEQRQEILDCIAAYGKTPMRAILDAIGDASRLTAVHCTHTTDEDRGAFLAKGGRICLCPLTEANLGDGLTSLDGVEAARCSLGTDSNARIDMFEEMRWLEYGQRLRGEARGTMVDEEGMVARTLLYIATQGGASSLGVPAGTITTGALADFTAVDIESPLLAGTPPVTLLEGMISGADGRIVTATAVGGHWMIHRPVGGI